jgi:hypothetical protein
MRRQAAAIVGNDAAQIHDAPDPGRRGGIGEDARRVTVALLERRARAQGMNEVIGHIDALQSAQHPGPLQCIGCHDLNRAGPGPVTQLPRVASHAPDGIPSGEQLRD